MIPQDWIPVITRDVERQRRGVPDTGLSDAYLCGMPLKRRKLASQHKPHGSVQQVIQGQWHLVKKLGHALDHECVLCLCNVLIVFAVGIEVKNAVDVVYMHRY